MNLVNINSAWVLNSQDNYDNHEIEIINLFKKYGNEKEIILVNTNIQQIRDKQLTEVERKTAAQKVKSYLFKFGKKAMDKAENLVIKTLIEYIDKQI